MRQKEKDTQMIVEFKDYIEKEASCPQVERWMRVYKRMYEIAREKHLEYQRKRELIDNYKIFK